MGSNNGSSDGAHVTVTLLGTGDAFASNGRAQAGYLIGDHYGGLPFLILEYMWETQRKRVLTIAGPRQLEERTWRLMRTMFPHFELDQIKHKLKFVVLEPGTTQRFGKFHVS